MTDPAMTALEEAIERALLDEIIRNLDREQMTEEEAVKFAQEFLKIIPFQDKHDLLIKLGEFSKFHKEAKSVFIKFAAPIEDEKRKRKLAIMSEHIKQGQISKALLIAKGESTNG